ncbi:MAG: DUF2076 domain-containing protein [Janthinobacterium lividum]
MTQQEQQLLNGLIERVNGTQLPSKDDEAEQLLGRALGTNPDALYILCQTVLVQQFAMDNAQRQLTEARAENDRLKAAKPQEHGSFLGNLFGMGHSENEVPQQQAPPQTALANQGGYTGAPSGYAPVANAPTAPYGQPMSQPGYGQPPYGNAPATGGGMFGSGSMFGGGGGFLQGAMQTAAGVVAGQFAFRAIEDVFHGFGGGGGGERGFGGGSEVVNNYYGNDSTDNSTSGDFGDRLRDADGLGNGMSSDIEDRRGDSHGFFGSADNSNDGSDFVDSSSDDGNSNDDGGSFDSGDSGSNDDGF